MAALIEWGVAARAFPGQTESGDHFLVKPVPKGVLVAVIDGLGHGSEAATAAKLAVATLEAKAHEEIIPLVQSCHEALKRTHGAVMSLACFDARKETMIWLGVGNVEGVLFRAHLSDESEQKSDSSGRETLLLRGGVVGYQLPPLRASQLSITPGDTLVFATDGIRNGFTQGLSSSGPIFLQDPLQQIADRTLTLFGKATDDALVLVARYRGAAA